MQRRALLLAGLGTAAGAGRAAADARPLQFPADFGAHPELRSEWWYATGWLVARDAPAQAAPAHGFQITFFRTRTAVPADHPSAFAAKQLVFAHAAVTDLAAGRLRHDQRISRQGFGLAQADTGDTALRLRDWQLRRQGPVGRSVYAAQAGGAQAGFALDLELAATQPVLLQGNQGFSQKGPQPEQASRYYTQPQLQAGGRLALDGRVQPVRGVAWLDHEWGERILHDDAVGWDWTGMNLLDGSALTAFRVRRGDGSALWAGGSFRAGGAAAARSFAAGEVSFTPLRHWTSPATQTRYPVQWQLQTPAGRFTIHPLLDAQEQDSRASTGTLYWEGLSELRDAQDRRVGLGYLELTGYAQRLRL